jgi:hypothetical protein
MLESSLATIVLVTLKSKIDRNIIFVSGLEWPVKTMVIMRNLVELIDKIFDDGECLKRPDAEIKLTAFGNIGIGISNHIISV